MSWRSWLPFLKAARPLPPFVPTDEVVPVHMFDDTSVMRELILMWTFRFEEVLDPEKLSTSLSQLFQMEGWRKLGGRFRLKSDGKLEIHIPRPFTEERRPLHFTKEDLDIPLMDHPEASKLPRASTKPSTHPTPRAFSGLGLGPGAARSFDDHIHADIPQFSLHVVTFTDATLVTVCFPHVSADLGGLASIVDAWSLILAGRSEAVPRFVGLREDSMAALVEAPPKERHVLADQQLKGWRLVYWAILALFEAWWYGSKSEACTLCIPKQTMEAMLLASRNQISDGENGPITSSSSDSLSSKPFITEGDVMTALASRVVAQSLQTGSTRQVMTMNVVNPRPRCKSVFRPDAAYPQNAPSGIFFGCKAAKARSMPLGQLALLNRQTIEAQCTEEQLMALARIAAQAMRTRHQITMFGEKDMVFIAISNWSKLALLDKMDFSPAVVKGALSRDAKRPAGHPVYYHSESLQPSSFSMIFIVIAGKDYAGDTWLSVNLSPQSWSDLLEHLNNFV